MTWADLSEWVGTFVTEAAHLLSKPEKLAALLGAIIVASKWLFEFSRKARLERFNKFEEMRKRADDGELGAALSKLDSSEEFTGDEVDLVMGFYEEIALMFNSRLISPAVAYYMFGYWIIKSSKSREFSTKYEELRGEYKDEDFWRVFESFRARMLKYHSRIQKYPIWGRWLLRHVRF